MVKLFVEKSGLRGGKCYKCIKFCNKTCNLFKDRKVTMWYDHEVTGCNSLSVTVT